jgi:hypothetical protein
MTQDNDKHDRALGLSPAQVAGSALAAMSGAFFASWLGTTGTLIGAAVGSVVATIGAAIYTHSLRRTGTVVKRTAVQVRHGALLTGAVPRPDPGTASDGPVRDPNAPREGDPPVEEAADHGDKGRGRLSTFVSEKLDLSWVRVALASLAVLVVALAGITVVEAITGKPIASWFGRDGGTGTTVGHVVGSDNKSSEQDKAPRKQTPVTPKPTPSESPSPEPQEPVPSTPSVPTPTPSPSTGADGAGAPPVASQSPDPGNTVP